MKRKVLSFILSAVMVSGMFPLTALPVSAITFTFKGVAVDAGNARYTVLKPNFDYGSYYDGMEINDTDLILEYTENTSLLTLSEDVTADILVVGGGGAGGTVRSSSYTGHSGGGGGGAGEVVMKENITLTAGRYDIGVGEGGSPLGTSTSSAAGKNGGDSTIKFGDTVLVDAVGGGGGGGESVGSDGASGGGGSYKSSTIYTGGEGTEGKGNAGGYATKRNAGGGGGAGANGGDAADTACGAGGEGVKCDITGEEKWYAAGGGGGTTNTSYSGGIGGSGIGGNGGGAKNDDSATPTPGKANTGSGGGGGGRYKGGAAGGSGVVIIRIKGVPSPDDGKTHVKTKAELTAALTAGGEIVLDNDIETDSFTISNDAPAVVLDLNGKTLTVETMMMTVVSIGTGTHFTLKDSSAEQTGVWDLVSTRTSGNAPQIAWVGSAVDILGGTVKMSNNYTGTGTVSGFNMRNLGSSVYLNVTGGKIEKMTGTAEGVSLKAYTATVTGGEIEDFDTSGKWQISGGVFGKKPTNTMLVSGCKILENTPVEGKWTVVSPHEITNSTPAVDKDTNNGCITIDMTKAFTGDTVTVTPVPNDGYILKTLKYNDGENHTVVADERGTYKFTMPGTAVTVSAEFEKLPYITADGVTAESGYIFGIPPKTSDFSDYIEAADGFDLEFSTSSPVTGTVVSVFKDGVLQIELTVVIKGDITGDGVCDVIDVAECERTANKHTELNGAYFKAADCSEDEAITVDDYSALVNLALA